MNIDIKFIASKADVSPATVSRVINGTKKVSPAVKERVLQIVHKYGYRPNCMARALVLKKSKLIGLMVPNVSNFFHSTVVSAIETVASQRGYGVIISNTSGNFDMQLKNLLSLSEHQIDGLILLHENTEAEMTEILKNTWVPIVTASITVPNIPLASVGIDEEEASYKATKHLLELGHTRIGGLFGNCYTLDTLRKNGFVRALAEHNIEPNIEHIAYCDCTIGDGKAACAKIFCNANSPTALFCISDEIAIGAINYLQENNISVPGDVSVVGFDDIMLATVFKPKLTTVTQPIEDIGKHACTLLLDILEEKEVTVNKIVLNSYLTVRESTAAPKKTSF